MYRQRSYALQQLIVALIASAGLTALLRWAGLNAMTVVLFILLMLFCFYAIAIARAMLLSRRPRTRPFGNGGGGDWSGEREPRRPHPPSWPPRAAAVMPEDTERQEPTSPVGYSDSPRQPLRLEDGLA